MSRKLIFTLSASFIALSAVNAAASPGDVRMTLGQSSSTAKIDNDLAGRAKVSVPDGEIVELLVGSRLIAHLAAGAVASECEDQQTTCIQFESGVARIFAVGDKGEPIFVKTSQGILVIESGGVQLIYAPTGELLIENLAGDSFVALSDGQRGKISVGDVVSIGDDG
ncbi:MAG: hypothetical protein R3C42_01165 [Parvularculaceae bacterium]